jgi:NAD(P)-dependent dehydrogenase (short-subunit alcohol dehydrogenase family)
MATENSSRIALITGGSRGLGRNMALHLADHGVDILLTYRSGEKEARDVAGEIAAKGRKAAVLQLDVADRASVRALPEAVKNALSRTWQRPHFDFLVNNAGSAQHLPFAHTTEAQFDEKMNIHLRAPFIVTQRLLPLLADGGRILNVSSGLARFTFPGSAAYATMKGGIEVLTRYLAKELGPRKIAVNVIAPGAIETDFGGGVVRDNREMNKAIASQTALGRVGLPDDIGGAVAMLLSPEANWITGQRVEFSGGMLL